MARTTKDMQRKNRQSLLAAAAREFAAKGLNGANINEISVGAGLAKGTVYGHFASKEALFLAVMREASELAVHGAEMASPSAPTKERLMAVLASDMKWVRENEPFARVLTRESLSADPKLFSLLIEAAGPYFSKVVEILQDGVRRKEVRADVPPAHLAFFFVGMEEVALAQHWGSGGAWPVLEEIPHLVIRQFLEGAASSGTRRKGRR
jgi:TetR/AcrR family transcriptional regulator